LALKIIEPEIQTNKVKLWLSHLTKIGYPRPLQCIHDNGSEFVGVAFQKMLASYWITAIITTVTNLQANAIIECINQVIAKMLRT